MIVHDNGLRELETADEIAATPGAAQCGECGRTWDDDHVSSMTPTPAGRCPFEDEHDETED